MKSAKKILIGTGIGLFVCFLIIVGLLAIPYFTNIIMPWERAKAIETTLFWGGLADLPNNSNNIVIQKSGSMFTRSFTLKFDSDKTNIQNWIKRSKRIKDMTPLEEEKGILIYEYTPGENGAVGGKVMINKLKTRVTIIIMWS